MTRNVKSKKGFPDSRLWPITAALYLNESIHRKRSRGLDLSEAGKRPTKRIGVNNAAERL